MFAGSGRWVEGTLLPHLPQGPSGVGGPGPCLPKLHAPRLSRGCGRSLLLYPLLLVFWGGVLYGWMGGQQPGATDAQPRRTVGWRTGWDVAVVFPRVAFSGGTKSPCAFDRFYQISLFSILCSYKQSCIGNLYIHIFCSSLSFSSGKVSPGRHIGSLGIFGQPCQSLGLFMAELRGLLLPSVSPTLPLPQPTVLRLHVPAGWLGPAFVPTACCLG